MNSNTTDNGSRYWPETSLASTFNILHNPFGTVEPDANPATPGPTLTPKQENQPGRESNPDRADNPTTTKNPG